MDTTKEPRNAKTLCGSIGWPLSEMHTLLNILQQIKDGSHTVQL